MHHSLQKEAEPSGRFQGYFITSELSALRSFVFVVFYMSYHISLKGHHFSWSFSECYFTQYKMIGFSLASSFPVWAAKTSLSNEWSTDVSADMCCFPSQTFGCISGLDKLWKTWYYWTTFTSLWQTTCCNKTWLVYLVVFPSGVERSPEEMSEGKVDVSTILSPFTTREVCFSEENFDKLVKLTDYNVLNNEKLIIRALRMAVARRKQRNY